MAVSLAGRLLVALPELDDPNFYRAVVYLLDHDRSGAVGVVINRPSQLHVVAEFPMLGRAVNEPSVFFEGGPVAEHSVVALAAKDGSVEMLELEPLLRRSSERRHDVRLFVGYSGWGPGQLDGEVVTGSWLVAEGSLDDVFAEEPEDLWRSVLRRQDGPAARLAFYPDELIAN